MGFGAYLAIAAVGTGSVLGFIEGKKRDTKKQMIIAAFLLGVFVVFVDLVFSWIGCLLSILTCRSYAEILMVSEVGILKGVSVVGYFLISSAIGAYVALSISPGSK
jgi:uncharacterized membrane protein (Fun14 family)